MSASYPDVTALPPAFSPPTNGGSKDEDRLYTERLEFMGNEAHEVLTGHTIPEMVKVVTYRGDCNKHLQLCARAMNSFMRENYTGFIRNVGKNIYPLIIASDYEPGFEGVGSSFTLFLKDGSQHKIAPTANSDYEIYKALSHMSLAMFIILTPHLENPKNIAWRGKINELKNHIEIFRDAAINSEKPATLKELLENLIVIYLTFINTILKDGTFSLESFTKFTSEAFNFIRVNMAAATLEQARCILPAMIKWKRMLGPAEWSKVYIMIPTVWPVALNSPRLQLFERIIDPDKVNTHIITSEHPRSHEEARDVVGRVVGDRTVGRLVFGTADKKAVLKVLALSSRTDVVADDFELSLNKVFDDLPPEDKALVYPPRKERPSGAPVASSASDVDENGIPSACPMHKPRAAAAAATAVSVATSSSPATSTDPAGIKIIRRARLVGKSGLFDIGIADGLIRSVDPAESTTHLDAQARFAPSSSGCLLSSAGELDAAGRTVLPGFVDAHIHVDKCYLLSRCCAAKGDFPEALSETLAAKKNFTVADVQARARRLIESQIAHGTTFMRAHVEVDPIVGMTALDAILPLKEEYNWAITIQINVFAQEGITNQPGQVELMREALKRGCECVGSAPYCDPQPQSNIGIIFDLAQEFNVFVDFHLDYHLEGKPSLLSAVLMHTLARGFQGRVCCGHMTHLSTLPMEELQKVGKELADAGVSVLCLPASDVCMMGRADNGNKRRGVCPVHLLHNVGVCGALATNNVQNLFTFTGDGDVLKVATLTAQMLQLTSTSDAELCLAMASTHAARAIGRPQHLHTVAVGASADLCIIKGESALELLACPPVERVVIKSGRVVSQTSLQQRLFKS